LKKLRQFWRYLWASLWFLPGVLVLAAVLLAVMLVDLGVRVDSEALQRWPRLFGAGAAGSRGMLQVIATSMITVAGVVFSITIAALAQASSQYSSRVLRKFMSDRTNQLVLGVFVSIFVYCLVVLRTIRGGDEGAFVPSLAVLGGIILSFVGIGFLIYFIHHIATSVQAAYIVAGVARETRQAIDHLFPQRLGEDPDEDVVEPVPALLRERTAQPVPARQTGYIQAVDLDALLAFARDRQLVVRMEHGIGDFAIEDTTLVSLLPRGRADAMVDDATIEQLNAAYAIGRQRTVVQDAAFGIRQIVDVAVRALSTGINDTTTAVLCVDHLAAILVRLARRHIDSPYRYEGAELRVIACGSTFADLLSGAYDEIRRNGAGHVTVSSRLIGALNQLAGVTTSRQRRQALLDQALALQEAVQRSICAPAEREELAHACHGLVARLRHDGSTNRG